MSHRPLPLAALTLLAACQLSETPPTRASAPRARDEALAHGEILYSMHCVVCHGTLGRGDGEAARFLFPPARDFGAARFRLVRSRNGAPADSDLVATLRRGIPGSAMPAWGWLGDEDLSALAGYVRFLAEQGLRQDLEDEARLAGDALLEQEAERIARARLTSDAPQPEPLASEPSAATLAHGGALFALHCSACHGADGRSTSEPRVDEDGTLNWARDLAAGFLKGGDAPYELACRIRAGMPGTAMPPTELTPADEAALLAFLGTLIPPGTSTRLVHRRETLRARRVSVLPAEPDDAAWSDAEEIDVVLAPLRWHDAAVFSARLAALHDGAAVALRLTWPDETGLVRLFASALPTDAAALQLSPAARPALFGMGAPGEPTLLWHWQALRLEDVAGALDLLDWTPHTRTPTRPGAVRADAPRYERLLDLASPSARADQLPVEGLTTLHSAARTSDAVQASARWRDEHWSVVFTRPLAAPLLPGARLQLACAIWNGATGDAGPQKSISIWQELRLAP